MNIGITNDHRGLQVKQFLTEYLENLGYNVIDYGTDSEEPADFPDYAKKLGLGIISNEVDLGIAICGTGIGMSIALNKMKNVYCAKVSSTAEASLSRAHNNANVIALPGRFINVSQAVVILRSWLATEFMGGRHSERVQMIADIEKENMK